MQPLQRLSITLYYVMPLALLLAYAQGQCRRRFTSVGADCGTVTDTCTLDDVFGAPITTIAFPSDNRYECYRTCYVNGEQGDCITNFRFNRKIRVYAPDPPNPVSMFRAMKFSSPNYHRRGGIGNYRKSNICRYHVKCEGSRLLYYTITGQTMQDMATCSGTPNTCVDRLRLSFPGMGFCERCSSMNNAINNNCMDRSGLGNEMMVEFVVNRETNHPGFEILAHCVDPGFDQNNIPPPSGRKRRQADECTSPDGIGPRDLPPVPLPAERLQRVLDEDPAAVYRLLEGPEDKLTYKNNILELAISQSDIERFQGITSLLVENPFDVRRYFRIAPGNFTGFAQLVLSGNRAFLVQFGINPNLMPSEEESEMAFLLDSATADAVSELEQFDVLDELDLLEQGEDFRVAVNSSEPQSDSNVSRQKRGIDPGFIKALALEYGNACNGMLRTSACIFQQVVIGSVGRDCLQ